LRVDKLERRNKIFPLTTHSLKKFATNKPPLGILSPAIAAHLEEQEAWTDSAPKAIFPKKVNNLMMSQKFVSC